MNKFSSKLTNTRSRLLDAEATLQFLNDRENLNNVLDQGCPDVVLGALISQVDNLVSQACEDCELMEKVHNEDFMAELKQSAREARDYLVQSGQAGSQNAGPAAKAKTEKHERQGAAEITKKPFIDPVDDLGMLHSQTKSMLLMMMLYLEQAREGGSELSGLALENYVGQLMRNMEQAEQATQALTEIFKQEACHE